MSSIKNLWQKHKKVFWNGLLIVISMLLTLYLVLRSAIPLFMQVIWKFIITNPFLVAGGILFILAILIWVRFDWVFGKYANAWKVTAFILMATAAIAGLLTRDAVSLSAAEKIMITEQARKQAELLHLKKQTQLEFSNDSLRLVLSASPTTTVPVVIPVDSVAIWKKINERHRQVMIVPSTDPDNVKQVEPEKRKAPVKQKKRKKPRPRVPVQQDEIWF